MATLDSANPAYFPGEINLLFYQRTRVCLWLGVIFFSLFVILDYICFPDLSFLFGFYRFCFVILLLLLLALLRLRVGKRFTRTIMYFGMLAGTATISMMIVKLGGFTSGYYVGILLMMAGGFSVLPLTALQAIGVGIAMFSVYVATVILGTENWDDQESLQYAINNTFFFLSIIGVTATQCFDDLRSQIQALQAKRRLRVLTEEVRQYKYNLEGLVIERMQQQEETELRFRDLYDNIDDLILVIDREGTIRQFNRHAAELLNPNNSTLNNRNFSDFLAGPAHRQHEEEIRSAFERGEEIRGRQVQLVTENGTMLDIEISGALVAGDSEQTPLYQLMIRDITATKEMERRVLESRKLIDSSRQAAIFGLAHLAECRDNDTGAHLHRMREYTRVLAEGLAEDSSRREFIDETFLRDIYRSSVLHDIGKVATPDEILLKPGKLSREEMDVMQQHCTVGCSVLKDAEHQSGGGSFLTMAQEITLCHHERWDGSGYPGGLSGEAIPLAARIVALADVYDALTSSRTYKPAFSHDRAYAIITSESGKHFDPMVVKAFKKRENLFIKIRKDLLLK